MSQPALSRQILALEAEFGVSPIPRSTETFGDSRSTKALHSDLNSEQVYDRAKTEALEGY